MLRQKACKTRGVPPHLDVINEQGNIKRIIAKNSAKCLGATLQNNLQWQAFLESGEDPLIPILRKKLGILKCLGKNIPTKSKKLLANGLIVGKLNFLITLYGGSQKKYLDKLQIILNNAARFVLSANKRTKSSKLMQEMNWLNIREMIEYFTLVATWKILKMNTPQYFASKIDDSNQDGTITTNNPRLQNTEMALRWRMCKAWNKIPSHHRQINTLQRFKSATKTWIKSNRPPDPGTT